MIPLSGTSLSGNFFSALPADLRPFEPVNRLFGYFPHKIKVTLLTGLLPFKLLRRFVWSKINHSYGVRRGWRQHELAQIFPLPPLSGSILLLVSISFSLLRELKRLQQLLLLPERKMFEGRVSSLGTPN